MGNTSFGLSSVTPGHATSHSMLTFLSVTSSASNYKQGSAVRLSERLMGLGIAGFFLAGKFKRFAIGRTVTICAVAVMILGGLSCGSTSVPVGAVSTRNHVVTVSGKASSGARSATVVVAIQ